MKKIIVSLVIAFIVIPSTYASSIIFTGQITQIDYFGDVTTPDGIVNGLNYTATIEYDPNLPFNNYDMAMHVEFGDGHFINSVYSTGFKNDFSDYGSVEVYDSLEFYSAPDQYSDFPLTTNFSSFNYIDQNITLRDSSATIFDSTVFPESIDLNGFDETFLRVSLDNSREEITFIPCNIEDPDCPYGFYENIEYIDERMIITGSVDGVSIVPVPAAVWLFGSGLIGLIGVARRKKT